MMESFNRVKEFVVTLMIRCAASLLAVYYTCKRTTHIKSNRLSSLSLFDFLYLMSLYMFCVCVCTADQRLFFSHLVLLLANYMIIIIKKFGAPQSWVLKHTPGWCVKQSRRHIKLIRHKL